MSRELNNAIKKAVDKHNDKGVKYLGTDFALKDGHWFCEEGVHWPD